VSGSATGANGGASLVTYSSPPGIAASTGYSVQVSQQGAVHDSFVYSVPNQWPSDGAGYVNNAGSEIDTAWTSFSYAGQVTVTVSNLLGTFASARVLPSSARITPTISGNRVSFTLDNQSGQFAVDFCASGSPCTDSNDPIPLHPMLVFANPLETSAPDASDPDVVSVSPGTCGSPGADIPSLGGSKSVLYFAPGVYDLGSTPYPLMSNQTVYLAGGAYVMGAFLGDSIQNTQILGRGILSGEGFHRNPAVPGSLSTAVAGGTPVMIDVTGNQTTGVTIDGITLVQSPFYNVELAGADNTVNNVKVIAWYDSTDGVQVAYDSLSDGQQLPGGGSVTNSFFKVGDDAIKLFSSNLTVSKCTIWKLQVAAAFELGANLALDISDVAVSDSDVIRTEYTWPSRTNAVFAANHGGAGNLSRYTFDDVRVENSSWQLFQIAVTPNAWLHGSTELGSISQLTFNNIQVADAQSLPDLFQGYSIQHPVSDVTLDSVVVDGEARPTHPAAAFDANRAQSLGGDVVSDPLWGSQSQPGGLLAMLMNGSSASPAYSSVTLSPPGPMQGAQVLAVGDFYGDGFASVLGEDPTTRTLVVWQDPAQSGGSGAHAATYSLPSSDWVVAGTGDFNGDGITDIVTWNANGGTGTVLLMNGATVTGTIATQPVTASDWQFAGAGDFDQNGCSDLLLRDSSGNLEILYFGLSAQGPVSTDFAAHSLGYGSQGSEVFDTSWSVAAVADVVGDGYASIVWQNAASGQVGYTYFTLPRPQNQWGQMVASLESGFEIQDIGDFNGDGRFDLWLWSPSSGDSLIWFMNSSSSGAASYHAPSPVLSAPGPGWRALGYLK